MNIALFGYGAMGKEIERIAIERGHSVVHRFDISSPPPDSGWSADCAIDFSHASAVLAVAQSCVDNNIPLVIGTTGWNQQLEELNTLITQSKIRAVYGSNFSVGMQLFLRIVQRASQLLDSTSEYDVFLHEFHHHRKKDSPSGTALSIAERMLEQIERKKSIYSETSHDMIEPSALHVTSTRGGEIAGTHTVYADSIADTIELTHRAKNRMGFALGAVKAGEWLYQTTHINTTPELIDFSTIFEDVIASTNHKS
jgi:4-hydroxy-tetrahydrodipicolinate reductase